jgi:hypothetical protein
MSFFSQLIVKKSKDIENEEVEMIFRNMTGEVPLRVVVLKTAFFTDVRAYVAGQMGLTYCETRLIVNEEEPDGLRQIESLLPSLAKHIMVDLLVDKEETEFECPLCHQRRDISQCREWEQLHQNRCIPCHQGGQHMCCWMDVEDEEYDEDNLPALVE